MKRKGWFGLASLACMACCLAPLWVVGVADVAAISADTWICSALMLLAAGIVYWHFRQRRLQSCGDTNTAHCATDCECKPD